MNTLTLLVNQESTPFSVRSFEGIEAISRDYEFKLDLECSGDENIKILDYLNQPTSISLNFHNHIHNIHGVISSMEKHFTSDLNKQYFEIRISSILQTMHSSLRSDIYIEQPPTEVISEVFSHYFQLDFHIATIESLPVKRFIHQHKESDFNFISRLCEHWGIYFYFDHEDNDKLIFADDNQYPIEERLFEFIEQPSAEQRNIAITSLTSKSTQPTEHVIIQGRNPENDMILIEAEAGVKNHSQSSYTLNNLGIDDEVEAQLLAHRRLEQFQCSAEEYTGTSNANGLKPGYVIKIQTNIDTSPIELLITEVRHKAVNLDLQKNDQGDEYFVEFKAIPAHKVFRPEPITPKPCLISTSARVFSSYETPDVAHRDHLGRYKVSFNYHSSDKVSHWIRRSLTAAKDNHLEIPLLPGTEVQISYLGGNPDLPYISSALENSQSTLIRSNNENPYTANLSTTGMLHLEAGRSLTASFRVSNLGGRPPSAPTFSIHSDVNNYNRLDVNGGKFQPVESLSLNNTNYHLSIIEGPSYKIYDSQTYYLGNLDNYYFGNQYKEVHAYHPDQKHADKSFDFNHHMIFENDKRHYDAQSPFPVTRQVGISRKLFGNRYNYHDGNIVTVRKNDNGPHRTMNYGAQYIENILDENHIATNSLTQGFPNDQLPSSGDHIVRSHLKNFKIYHDDTTVIQEGSTYIKRLSDTTRIQTGGSSTVEIRGTNRNKDIDIDGYSRKSIKAESIETTLQASDIYKKITGNRRTEVYGSSNSMILGAKTSCILGTKNELEALGTMKNIIGVKNENILGAKVESLIGASVKFTKGPEIKAGAGNVNKEGFSLKSAEVEINKMKAEISCIENLVYTGRLFMLG